ncbi:MAG: hypothetical protein LBR08_02315 [Bacteroidales bacterium]|jgi:hypothetical protein|nr:hypothetical protein [Bacteroidales bacterium]
MSSGKDYIPTKDKEFSPWATNLIDVAAPQASLWNIPMHVFPDVMQEKMRWDAAYALTLKPETRNTVTIREKDDARKALKTSLRRIVKAYLIANPEVTDADRDRLGIPIHDTTPSTVPPPAVAPVISVDFSNYQRHIIHVKDILGKARPEYAHGFEMWGKVGGEPPTEESDYRYAGFSTKSPFTIDYPIADRGKTVYYRCHWVNAKNQPGPWSAVVQAIIA